MSKPQTSDDPRRALPARPAEQRALEMAAELPGERVLCTSVGRAQAALSLAQARPAARIVAWFLDQHHQRLATQQAGGLAANLEIVCSADSPAEQVDLSVVPLSKHGEAELSRDLLQSACRRLAIGGTLVTAVDNPRDRWLHEALRQWFDKVAVHKFDDATAYSARKVREPRKWSNFRCEFAFRDQGNLVCAVSRPGVFAHRRVDPGARQLLAAARAGQGEQVLDIGCGSGVVGLALAMRDPTVTVHAVDSHARAVECTLAGAALNGLTAVTAELNHRGEYGLSNSFDLAVANPPYYADFQIAALFLTAARQALKPGGRVIFVTKHPAWYEQALARDWTAYQCWPSKRYHIVEAAKA